MNPSVAANRREVRNILGGQVRVDCMQWHVGASGRVITDWSLDGCVCVCVMARMVWAKLVKVQQRP